MRDELLSLSTACEDEDEDEGEGEGEGDDAISTRAVFVFTCPNALTTLLLAFEELLFPPEHCSKPPKKVLPLLAGSFLSCSALSVTLLFTSSVEAVSRHALLVMRSMLGAETDSPISRLRFPPTAFVYADV